MKMLIFGHGYSAGFLTPALIARGWQVSGTTRADPDRVAAAGAAPLIWPGQRDAVRAAIDGADAVLVSVAPGSGGDPVLAAFGADLARARPGWLGYLSTTGVYGDRQGGWVDEDSATDASGPEALFGGAGVRAARGEGPIDDHRGDLADAQVLGAAGYLGVVHVEDAHFARAAGDVVDQVDRRLASGAARTEDFYDSLTHGFPFGWMGPALVAGVATHAEHSASEARRGHAFHTQAAKRVATPA